MLKDQRFTTNRELKAMLMYTFAHTTLTIPILAPNAKELVFENHDTAQSLIADLVENGDQPKTLFDFALWPDGPQTDRQDVEAWIDENDDGGIIMREFDVWQDTASGGVFLKFMVMLIEDDKLALHFKMSFGDRL